MKKFLVSALVASMLLSLTGCSWFENEKDRFVSAAVEIGCTMFQDQTIFNDLSKLEAKTQETFTKYGFDVKDADAMKELNAKYKDDKDVLAGVQAGVTKCAGNVFDAKAIDQAANGTGTPAVTDTTKPAATTAPVETPKK